MHETLLKRKGKRLKHFSVICKFKNKVIEMSFQLALVCSLWWMAVMASLALSSSFLAGMAATSVALLLMVPHSPFHG